MSLFASAALGVFQSVNSMIFTSTPCAFASRAASWSAGVCGVVARRFVMNAALYKQIDVRPVPPGKDPYGKTLAVVEIPGVGILQEMLLSAGLAWVHPKYCRDCDPWKAMQAEAKARGRGLWARKTIEGKAVPPWEWKKM